MHGQGWGGGGGGGYYSKLHKPSTARMVKTNSVQAGQDTLDDSSGTSALKIELVNNSNFKKRPVNKTNADA